MEHVIPEAVLCVFPDSGAEHSYDCVVVDKRRIQLNQRFLGKRPTVTGGSLKHASAA